MNSKKSKYSIRSNYTLSLNEDRGECFWQQERGVRYGNSRKARAKAKVQKRRSERRKNKNFVFEN